MQGEAATDDEAGECTEILRDPKYATHVPYPLAHNHAEISAAHGLLRWVCAQGPDAEFLGHRAFRADGSRGDYVWLTRAQVLARATHTALALRHVLGLPKGACVACVAQPREDWHVLHFACSLCSCVFVPLFDGLGSDALAQQLAHCDAAVLFCASHRLSLAAAACEIIAATATAAAPRIVAIDSYEHEHAELLAAAATDTSGRFHMLQSDLERRGAECGRDDLDPAGENDPSLILYTSGTTGTPKGVVLSQTAAISGSVALYERIPDLVFSQQIVYLSFLPLSHVFGIGIDMAAIRACGKIGYFGGDTRNLVEDVQVLRPTVMAGVPRVYQRMYEGILGQIAKMPIHKRVAFSAAYAWRKAWLQAGYLGPGLADKFVFDEIRARFGGRVLVMICGGAPLAPWFAEFFRVAVTDLFLEGWGMTETAAWGMCRDGNVDPMSFGHCGVPYCMCEIKLKSVPSLGYSVRGKKCRGELLVRGPCCFTRYHKDPELTRQTIDAEGFVHTGDIVELLQPHGYLAVIDRKKAMFKLAQGEYVSPENVERVIAQSPFVQDVFVHGDSIKNFPVAVVVPKADALREWASTQNGLGGIANDMEQLCHNQRVVDFILSEIDRVSTLSKLHGYEKCKAVLLDPEPFEEGNRGFVSPSLKLRREIIRKFFERELEALYASESYKEAVSRSASGQTPAPQ